MQEEWRPVIYPNVKPDIYLVSNYGAVKNAIIGDMLRLRQNAHGYAVVSLKASSVRTSSFLVHRLVATAFIPNPDNKPQIDHIDGNRCNNNLENLRWCTQKENSNNSISLENNRNCRDSAAKTSKRRVLCITTGDVFESITAAAKHFGITESTVASSCARADKPLKVVRTHMNGRPVYRFKHLETIDVRAAVPLDSIDFSVRCSPLTKPVKCLEDGIIYPSIGAAAKRYGIACNTIRNSCNRRVAGNKMVHTRGTLQVWHFEWVDEYKPETKEETNGSEDNQ